MSDETHKTPTTKPPTTKSPTTNPQATDPRSQYGGLRQVTVHVFDCHGFDDSPEQHVGSITFPDYGTSWGEDIDSWSVDLLADRVWNLHVQLRDLIVMGTCFAVVGRDDPRPTHGDHHPPNADRPALVRELSLAIDRRMHELDEAGWSFTDPLELGEAWTLGGTVPRM